MTLALTVLCVSAFTIVAVGASGGLAASQPLLDSIAERLSARSQVRFWLAVALAPAVLAAAALSASLLPAVGWAPDHCLGHDAHHLHLCPRHMGGTPAIGLYLIATAIVARSAQLVVACVRNFQLIATTGATLGEGCERRGDLWVFEGAAPEAFVLGAIAPRIFVSRAMLALGESISAPAIAHERIHRAHRDLLWRMLYPVLAFAHLPWVARLLAQRHGAAQEMAADEGAAAQVRDPVLVAEALLTLTRFGRQRGMPAIAFAHGDVAVRVRALLQPRAIAGGWLVVGLLAACLSVPAIAALSHHEIHHGLETLLGALS